MFSTNNPPDAGRSFRSFFAGVLDKSAGSGSDSGRSRLLDGGSWLSSAEMAPLRAGGSGTLLSFDLEAGLPRGLSPCKSPAKAAWAAAQSRPLQPLRVSRDLAKSGEFTIGAFHGPTPSASPTAAAGQGRGPRGGARTLHISADAASRRHQASLPPRRSSADVERRKQEAAAAGGAPPCEVAALDARLRSMFKLQLGPLTLGRDVAPVVEMWGVLCVLRERHGRRALAQTWLTLAHATSIVARKMELPDVTAVVAAHARLANPCPRTLRLPAAALAALADRASAGGGQLRGAGDEAVLRFCRAAGELLRVAGGYHFAGAAASFCHVERALGRVVAVMPLVQAGLEEVLRRGRLAARLAAAEAADGGAEAARAAALFVAEALAHLAGCALNQPHVYVQRAQAAAVAEAEAARARAHGQPLWRRVLDLTHSQAAASGGQGPATSSSAAARAATVLPTYLTASSAAALRAAGAAAECLARCLAPVAVPGMSAAELGQFASALSDASAGEEGQPALCEPLHQCLGLVLAEAAARAGGAGQPACAGVDARCVKEVIAASRARILSPAAKLAAPAGGVPRALAVLKAWEGRQHAGPRGARAPRHAGKAHPPAAREGGAGMELPRRRSASPPGSEEATSLEMEGGGEEGEAEVMGRLAQR